jgi:hypothetical protein
MDQVEQRLPFDFRLGSMSLELCASSDVCVDPGWILVEVQERLRLSVEDTTRLLDEAGNQPDLPQQRFETIERIGPGVFHTNPE